VTRRPSTAHFGFPRFTLASASIPRPSTSRRRRTGSGCGPVSGPKNLDEWIDWTRSSSSDRAGPRPPCLRGTAAERLGEAIALGDPLSLTVVVNSYVVAYFTEADQASFFEDMAERCAGGNVAWISLESPFMVNWPTSSRSSEGAKTGATQVIVTLPGGSPSDWDGVITTACGRDWTYRSTQSLRWRRERQPTVLRTSGGVES